MATNLALRGVGRGIVALEPEAILGRPTLSNSRSPRVRRAVVGGDGGAARAGRGGSRSLRACFRGRAPPRAAGEAFRRTSRSVLLARHPLRDQRDRAPRSGPITSTTSAPYGPDRQSADAHHHRILRRARRRLLRTRASTRSVVDGPGFWLYVRRRYKIHPVWGYARPPVKIAPAAGPVILTLHVARAFLARPMRCHS